MPGLRTAISRVAADAHRRLLADGRGARTVVLKLKRTGHVDPHPIGHPRRGTTGPGHTPPRRHSDWRSTRWEIGPIRLVFGSHRHRAVHAGPEVPGTMFDTTATDTEISTAGSGDPEGRPGVAGVVDRHRRVHADTVTAVGLQGAGHGVVTVRFETSATDPAGRSYVCGRRAPNCAAPTLDSLMDGD